MLLKKKRNIQIKVRECADGSPQRIYKSKEETSSPTPAIKYILIISTIEALEQRDVAMNNIPGALLHRIASDSTVIKAISVR